MTMHDVLWAVVAPLSAAAFVAVLALIKAFAEIELEGKHGWAARSATSFRVRGKFAEFYAARMNGKPVTFWNVSEQLFFFVALLAIGFLAWLAVYDFDWFLFHVHYNKDGANLWNWEKMFPAEAWWHKVRIERAGFFKGLPVDYLGVVLLPPLGAVRCFTGWSFLPIIQTTVFMIVVVAVTALAYRFGLLPYQRWYVEAHKPENDERHLAIPPEFLPDEFRR